MNETFAMDTGFYNSLGVYDFGSRCEMTAELGYNATYLTLWSEDAWDDLPKLREVEARYGLEVAAVWLPVDLANPDRSRSLNMLRKLEGCKRVEVSLSFGAEEIPNSAVSGDSVALATMSEMMAAAQESGVQLLLYPHVGTWLERAEDAVRLCREVGDHARLAMTFPTFHWYTVDGSNLCARLAEALPYIELVNLCGARRSVAGGLASIETLDRGELDNFAVLGLLRKLGFSGPLGVQGYSVAGDSYENLKRSLAALKSMHERLNVHPEWARLVDRLR